MKNAKSFKVILVTVPDLKTARKVASAVLKARAAACVNIVPGLESHYWWQNKLETSRELLLLIKTTKNKLADLETVILKNHPYDTPEIIALPLKQGNAKYLKWISKAVK